MLNKDKRQLQTITKHLNFFANFNLTKIMALWILGDHIPHYQIYIVQDYKHLYSTVNKTTKIHQVKTDSQSRELSGKKNKQTFLLMKINS